MKKQISGMEMVIIAVMAMVALIAVYAAGTQLTAPALPSIESNSPAISKDVEKSETPAIGNMAGEGQGLYSAVVFNPATGAEVVEWNAPRVSSLSTAAATEGVKQYGTVIFNPGTGQAEAVEYFAPTVGSLETAAAAPESAIAGEGQTQFRTVVVHPETGAKLFEWNAPSVSSLSSGAAAESAQYSTVVLNSATGQAEVVKWQAPEVR